MKLSKKLIIGTAQFGQNYGVTNVNGKVAQKEITSILRAAQSNGIRTLDTASSYGDSERRLGDEGVSDFDIITKLPSFVGVSSDFYEFCQKSISSSLVDLNQPCVDTVLLHRSEDLLGVHGDAIFNALKGLKDNGLVKNIGISIYSPEILDNIFNKYQLDVVQVPLNIFDRRIISSGWLHKLSDKGVSVLGRSVFLQGILLSSMDEMPSYFREWLPHLKSWRDFCIHNNLSALEASLQFVSQIPEIEKIIVGIESERQLSEIVEAISGPIMIESSHLESNDLGLISPIHWSI